MTEISTQSGFASHDRAANYGDGVFSTLRLEQGRVALFERHCQRLLGDAGKIGLQADEHILRKAILAAAAQYQDGVLKVLISAGTGGRGYARQQNPQVTVHISHHSWPEHYLTWQRQGIAVAVSELQLGNQPLLAGIKHLNRLEQVLIKRAMAAQPDIDDVIVCDSENCVIEASAANVFWYQDGIWYTPSLEQAGVAGVMRQFLLTWFAQHGVEVQTGRFHVSQLQHCEAMLLCNALMPVIPVQQLTLHDTTVTLDVCRVTDIFDAIGNDYRNEYEPVV